MKLLAIESAFETCSVALWLDGDCHQRFTHEPRSHATHILPWVDELLAIAGMSLGQLDGLAFSQGPGSFTSLRIGIGIVQGLAWGADIAVAPVSSLQITAQQTVGLNVSNALVAMDARMNEVYSGRFTVNLTDSDQAIMQPAGLEQVCPPATLLQEDNANWSCVGNGFVRFDSLVALGAESAQEIHGEVIPMANTLAMLGERRLADGLGLPAEQAQPVYLRKTLLLIHILTL